MTLESKFLKVEQFGEVSTNHINQLNHQLQEQLKEFDRLYSENGGHLGSLGYQFDKLEFTRLVSEQLIEHARGCLTNQELDELSTVTEFYCKSIPHKFDIKTRTQFNSSNNEIEIFNPCLN